MAGAMPLRVSSGVTVIAKAWSRLCPRAASEAVAISTPRLNTHRGAGREHDRTCISRRVVHAAVDSDRGARAAHVRDDSGEHAASARDPDVETGAEWPTRVDVSDRRTDDRDRGADAGGDFGPWCRRSSTRVATQHRSPRRGRWRHAPPGMVHVHARLVHRGPEDARIGAEWPTRVDVSDRRTDNRDRGADAGGDLRTHAIPSDESKNSPVPTAVESNDSMNAGFFLEVDRIGSRGLRASRLRARVNTMQREPHELDRRPWQSLSQTAERASGAGHEHEQSIRPPWSTSRADVSITGRPNASACPRR